MGITVMTDPAIIRYLKRPLERVRLSMLSVSSGVIVFSGKAFDNQFTDGIDECSDQEQK